MPFNKEDFQLIKGLREYKKYSRHQFERNFEALDGLDWKQIR